MERLEEEEEEPSATVIDNQLVDEVADETKPPTKKCCTLAEVKARPEIVLWYMANCLSYLGFYMPFINLVSEKLW
jgi:hypothetical protein